MFCGSENLLYLIYKTLLKVNFFAAGRDKSLTERVFIKVEMIPLCLCAKFYKIYCQMIFTQFFNTFFFNIRYNYIRYKDNVRYKLDVIH